MTHNLADTSRSAFEQNAERLQATRARTLAELRRRPQTAFELAESLHEPFYNVQPACSKLRSDGQIKDSGERRPSPRSGLPAIVWKAVAP
jgi:hypothetical protein